MFIRKLYYDLTTGAVLDCSTREGSVHMTTFAQDCAALPTLAGRSEADTGCMVWTEPDAAVEAAFDACIDVRVDVMQTPHAIVWEYPPETPAHDEEAV